MVLNCYINIKLYICMEFFWCICIISDIIILILYYSRIFIVVYNVKIFFINMIVLFFLLLYDLNRMIYNIYLK